MYVGQLVEDALKLSLYTKIGDQGKTTFFGCGLVSKDDARIHAMGTLDELNSVIGLTLCFIDDDKLKEFLLKIQNDLFQLGADIAGTDMQTKKLPYIHNDHIKELEILIDEFHNNKLRELKSFILPGGTLPSSLLHLCRAVTRRAERDLVTLKKVVPHLNQETLIYVNRLSDFLFCLARYANKDYDVKEQEPIYKYFEHNNTEAKNI